MLRSNLMRVIAAACIVALLAGPVLAQAAPAGSSGGTVRVWRDGRFIDVPVGSEAATTTPAAPAVTETTPAGTYTAPASPLAAALTSPTTGPMRTKGAVNVRSGPGTYYYEVGKLSDGTGVEVLAVESGWSAIKPTSGMKALVRKDMIMDQGSGEGVVSATGRARVYAQGRGNTETWAVIDNLNTGDKVKIIAADGNFYQIEMPKAARAWIQSDLLQADTGSRGGDTAAEMTSLPEVKPMQIDPQLKVYQAAAAELKTEMQKPLADRKFETLETTFKEVAEKAEMDYVKAAARDALRRIDHQKFLQESSRTADQQRQELDRRLEEIRRKSEEEQTAAMKTAATAPIVAPDFEGLLRKNMAESAYPYRIEDKTGRFVAMLKSEAVNLEAMHGRVIKVWGDKRFLPDWKTYGVDVIRVELAE